MNVVAYLRDNLAGAWQVMFGRPDGLDRLDTSLEGFWRSFAAIALVIPLLLVADTGFNAMLSEEAPPTDRLGWVGLLIQSVDWVAFPIVFGLLSPRLGLTARYVPFITARNWAAVIVAAMYAAASFPGWVLPLPLTAAAIINLVCLGISLRFAYLLTKTTLVVGPSVAVPVVALEFVLSLVVGFGLVTLLEGPQ